MQHAQESKRTTSFQPQLCCMETMTGTSPVFKETYTDYLAQVANADMTRLPGTLGVSVDQKTITVPLFGKPYVIHTDAIIGPHGKRPPFDICVILCKYILLCPEHPSNEKEWLSYRDFKDSGPLTTYFSNDVEQALSGYFSGKTDEMKKAGRLIGGQPPDIDLAYDLALRFEVLPRVPLLLLYNEADEGFPAHCSVLFEKRAETFLDAECLAMAGRLLFTELKDQSQAS